MTLNEVLAAARSKWPEYGIVLGVYDPPPQIVMVAGVPKGQQTNRLFELCVTHLNASRMFRARSMEELHAAVSGSIWRVSA